MSNLVEVRKTCRLCNSPDIVLSVPLAHVPIVSPNVGKQVDENGKPLTQIVAPLDNYLCRNCGLNQLIHVVDSSLIYRDYLYRTSVSLGLREHFGGLSESVIDRLNLSSEDLVCEFGSNDGTLLRFFKDRGISVQGIDPARQIAEEATASGIPTIPDFFNVRIAETVLEDEQPAKAILANNAMANIDDLGEILRGVKTLLAQDGAFVFETQYALDMFENTLLDVIYHEHISTFSVLPVVEAFKLYGLEVFDTERIKTKGGSIRIWVQHEGGPQPISERVNELINLEKTTGLYDLDYHKRFADRVGAIKVELHDQVKAVRDRGGKVGAYGTSVGSAALIHQFELEDKIDVLFDDTPFKERLTGPGYDLPVMTADGVYEVEPELIIILAWRYSDPISAKHEEFINKGGKFVVPLPELKIIKKKTAE